MGVEIKFGVDLSTLAYQDILDWLNEHKMDNVGNAAVYHFWQTISAYKDAVSAAQTPGIVKVQKTIRDAILAGNLPKFDTK